MNEVYERRKEPARDQVQLAVSISIFTAVIIGVGFIIVFALLPTNPTPIPYYEAISVGQIKNSLSKLEEIANNDGGGSRSILTGFNASATWLMGQLSSIDCLMQTQHFAAPSWKEHDLPYLFKVDPPLEYQFGVDFKGIKYGGNGSYDFIKNVSSIQNFGCNISDFVSPFKAKDIALIQIGGGCDLVNKVFNAEKANASGVILYNSKNTPTLSSSRVITSPWFGGDRLVQIPVLVATYSVGMSLNVSAYGSLVHLRTNSSTYVVDTLNIWCDTKTGNPNKTIVVGAHLDSVAAGPGINDNGSGSCTILELLKMWYEKKMETINRIRFAWWGAEEEGLLGSRNYVRYLKQSLPYELKNIAFAFNLDMVGSPNYIPMIGIFPKSITIPTEGYNGSYVVSSLLENFFNETLKKPYLYMEMTSGSDHFSFLEQGIPAGRVHSGAAQIKTESYRTQFGGVANIQADPCYHLICDTVDNISDDVISYMSQAVAYVLQKLAQEPKIIDDEFKHVHPVLLKENKSIIVVEERMEFQYN